MASSVPYGRTLDTDFMFTKLIVDDIEKAAAFYVAVCGLVEMHRIEATIIGRAVTEIIYQPTYQGGPMFILAKFHGAPKPNNDELILGFATADLEAFLERVTRAGGRVVEPIQDPGHGMRHAFIEDVEGHVVQISERRG